MARHPKSHLIVAVALALTCTGTAVAESYFDNALRIARMVHDEVLVARLLAIRARGKDVPPAEISAVVAAFDHVSMPDAAVEFLRERIARYPGEIHTRIMLARLYARNGDSKLAVEAWKDQVRSFGDHGLTPDDTQTYARDLSRVGDLDGAYALLEPLKTSMPLTATSYWSDLALLAWNREDEPTALLAYSNLYRMSPGSPGTAFRLTTLLTAANRYDEARDVALAELRRPGGDPGAVLFLAHLRASRGEWRSVKSILEVVDLVPSTIHLRPDYIQLRADCLKQLGDLEGAWQAYLAVLALAPDDPTARANVLWTAVERSDDRQIQARVEAWGATARSQPVLWAPMATGLARIGRHAEAIVYLRLQLATQRHDPRTLLDLSESLGKIGRETLSSYIRRRVIPRFRRTAAATLRSGAPRNGDDLHLVEAVIPNLQERAGTPMADRWIKLLAKRSRGRADLDELSADFYLSTDRPEFARRFVHQHGLLKHRLTLALLDDDRTEIRNVLAQRGDLGSEPHVHGLLALDRDHEAAGVIGETLARDPNTRDEPALRSELERFAERHRPNLRAGASYVHVTGLDIYGPTAGAAHDGLGGRIMYDASGVRMTDRSQLLAGERYEASAGVVARYTSARGVTDIGVGASYQQEQGTPVGRAVIFDQRLLTSRLGLTTELRHGSVIEDTSFLRALGVRNSASIGLRYDWPHFYAAGEIEGREDQTRRYQHLAWDVVGSAEAGVKLLTREPHLSIGAQGQVSRRDNRTNLPADSLAAFSPGVSLDRALPPSFELVGGVVHFSRGDFSERYRPDRAPFPRYDCEAAIGAITPATSTAVHVLCGISVRAAGGYTSFVAFYNRSVAGVANAENAALSLSHTVSF